jgi:hydrogenase maturation protease
MSPSNNLLKVMKKKIGIICLGNPLRHDDGIGQELLQYLQRNKKLLSKNVDLLDGGTSGMNLLHHLEKYKVVILIDAVDFKGTPGEMKKFSVDEIKNNKIPIYLSTHEPDFLAVLTLAAQLRKAQTTLVIFGIQPMDLSPGIGLSPEVHKVLPPLKKQIFTEIQSMIVP